VQQYRPAFIIVASSSERIHAMQRPNQGARRAAPGKNIFVIHEPATQCKWKISPRQLPERVRPMFGSIISESSAPRCCAAAIRARSCRKCLLRATRRMRPAKLCGGETRQHLIAGVALSHEHWKNPALGAQRPVQTVGSARGATTDSYVLMCTILMNGWFPNKASPVWKQPE